jgi:hypothetical protein
VARQVDQQLIIWAPVGAELLNCLQQLAAPGVDQRLDSEPADLRDAQNLCQVTGVTPGSAELPQSRIV